MSAVDVIDAAINKVRQHAWPQTMDLEEARAAVAELIEAADCPNANIIFRESGPGYVTVPADDWNRLRTALANIGAAP